MNTLKLHEAMVIVLIHCPGKTASSDFIANEIISRNLYKQRDGEDVFPKQIYLRARRYPKFFELIDNETVKLI